MLTLLCNGGGGSHMQLPVCLTVPSMVPVKSFIKYCLKNCLLFLLSSCLQKFGLSSTELAHVPFEVRIGHTLLSHSEQREGRKSFSQRVSTAVADADLHTILWSCSFVISFRCGSHFMLSHAPIAAILWLAPWNYCVCHSPLFCAWITFMDCYICPVNTFSALSVT